MELLAERLLFCAQGALRNLHLPSARMPPSPALTNSPLSTGGCGDLNATRSHSSNDTSFSVPHLYEGKPPSLLAVMVTKFCQICAVGSEVS
jgi:hypothetical protein